MRLSQMHSRPTRKAPKQCPFSNASNAMNAFPGCNLDNIFWGIIKWKLFWASRRFLFKVNNGNTRPKCEIGQWCRSVAFIINFEHVSQSVPIIDFEQVNTGWGFLMLITLSVNAETLNINFLQGRKYGNSYSFWTPVLGRKVPTK